MAIRGRTEDRLTVEQARDREPVRAMLAAAGMISAGVEWPAACYLVAWLGDAPVGVIGVESRVRAALLRSLMVVEPMRRRGFGAELIAAARKAAHTRGAQTLYAFSTGGDYLRRRGFEPADTREPIEALEGTPLADYYRAHSDQLALASAWRLDISNDGVIVR
jgi:GNAT superfamily N-acetyltransferase